MSNKDKKTAKVSTGKAGLIVWASVSAFLVAVIVVLSVLANTLLYPIFTTVLGGRKPILGEELEQIYTSDYNSKNEVLQAGNELNVRIEEEGAVLLLNEDNALPLEKGSRVSVFGKNSVDLVLGGSGSGRVDGDGAASLFDGLDAGNIVYNPVLRSFYESNASGSGRTQTSLTESTAASPDISTGETPLSRYTNDVMNSLRNYDDAAIVVISRVGGESFDLPRTQDMANGGIEGNHYLQLDSNEYALLDMVTSRFDKVIVLLNTLQAFQCDFIDEYNNTLTDKRIDAVMWIGGPGTTGAEAIGSLLNGDVNPSGRTVDIYARDFTKDPTWQNFGDGSQTTDNNTGNTAFAESGHDVSGYNMVMYEEGVYLGYRYYETRDYEELRADSGSEWYEENVIFPFGYGLSYTTFDQRITQTQGSLNPDDTLTITVEVENTGNAAGKDAVQLYVSKPYTYGGIEKPYVELVDFAKTDVLSVSGEGSTQTVTFTVNAYDLASYDYNDANYNAFSGYELEEGDYTFFVAANSHVRESAYDSVTVNLAQSVTFPEDPVTDYPVVNRYTLDNYDDIQYRLSDVYVQTENNGDVIRKGMSRTDFEGTFPTAPTSDEREFYQDERDGFTERSKLESMQHNNTQIDSATEMPVTGDADSSDIVLRDLLGEDGTVSFNDARWEQILNKITFDEMLSLVNTGAFMTVAIESIGKNLTNESDGPIGFVNFMPGSVSEIFADNPTFAVEIVIGSTWNKDLAYQMGRLVGESGLWGDQSGNNSLPYSGWYAPAVNLHRSPFAGRNFEYYSEDPVLSGRLAVDVINGARTKGVYTDLKHFAINDQETNRAGVSTFCTEQALREIYLKPFEMAVKGSDSVSHVSSAAADGISSFAGTTGVMSSFNRIGNKWTGGDYRLLTEILRNEWGFRGLVICDYKTSNAIMNSRQMLYAGNDLILTSTGNCTWTDASSSSVQDVTVLRTAAKNILYTVANSNSIQIEIIGYQTEWWITAIIALDCIIPVCLAVWGFFAIRKFVKRRKA